MRLDPSLVDLLAEWLPRRDLEAARIIRSAPWCWFPVLIRMGAITFAPFILFRADRYRPWSAAGLGLIAHEVAHITQVRTMGRPRFYTRYLIGQLQCRFRHDRHPLEIPCIELQRRVRHALRARGFPP